MPEKFTRTFIVSPDLIRDLRGDAPILSPWRYRLYRLELWWTWSVAWRFKHAWRALIHGYCDFME